MNTDVKLKPEDFSGCKAISFTRCSIAPKSSGIWTVQTDLQQIYPKSDRLLDLLPTGEASTRKHSCRLGRWRNQDGSTAAVNVLHGLAVFRPWSLFQRTVECLYGESP
jgi:hypothetical protein